MIYDIANTTKPLVPENHRVMIDDIRGLVVAKTAHGYEYKDINDSDVAEFVNAHKTVPHSLVDVVEAAMQKSRAQYRADETLYMDLIMYQNAAQNSTACPSPLSAAGLGYYVEPDGGLGKSGNIGYIEYLEAIWGKRDAEIAAAGKDPRPYQRENPEHSDQKAAWKESPKQSGGHGCRTPSQRV